MLWHRWQKGDVYPSQGLGGLEPFLQGPWSPKGRPHGLDRYRERRSVLIPGIPPLSFQCASQDSRHSSSTNNLRPCCSLPASHPGLAAICNSAYPSSTTVSVSACKMSNLLLVTWLLCEIAKRQLTKAGLGGGGEGGGCSWSGQAEVDPNAPGSCLVPGLGFVTQNCSPEANCQVSMGGICKHQRNQPRLEKCWRHLGGLGKGKCPSGYLLLWRKEVWM